MLQYLLARLAGLFRATVSVVLGRFLSMALFILSARHFLPADNASFIYAITLPQLLIQLGTLGWLNLIRREISRRTELPPELLKGFVIRSLQIPMAVIFAITLVLVAAPMLMGGANAPLYACIAGVTVVYTLVFILREYLAALGSPAFGIWAAEVIPFAFTLGAIWWVQPESVETAALLFLVGLLLSCAIQIPAVLSALRPYLTSGRPTYDTRKWLRAGGFSLMGFGGRTALDRLDTIVLANLAPAIQFAYFNSAQRVTALLMLVPMVLLPVFSPHLSKAYSTQDMALLRRDMLLQTLLVSAGVFPLAAAMLIYPDTIMGMLYGEAYGSSGHIFGIIVFAQVLFAISLPWSNLALMCNREKLYGYAHIVAVLLISPIALGLVSNWGGMAIAISLLVANAFLFSVFFCLGLYDLMFRQEPSSSNSNS